MDLVHRRRLLVLSQDVGDGPHPAFPIRFFNAASLSAAFSCLAACDAARTRCFFPAFSAAATSRVDCCWARAARLSSAASASSTQPPDWVGTQAATPSWMASRDCAMRMPSSAAGRRP